MSHRDSPRVVPIPHNLYDRAHARFEAELEMPSALLVARSKDDVAGEHFLHLTYGSHGDPVVTGSVDRFLADGPGYRFV